MTMIKQKKQNSRIEQPFTPPQAIPNSLLHWFNILGELKHTTTTPSGRPKTFADGAVIYLNSVSSPTTKRLYLYCRATNSWYYVALT